MDAIKAMQRLSSSKPAPTRLTLPDAEKGPAVDGDKLPPEAAERQTYTLDDRRRDVDMFKDKVLTREDRISPNFMHVQLVPLELTG